MTASKTLIFFGNERLSSGFSPDGAPTLQALIDAGYHIAAVVSHYEAANSRKPRPLEIEAVAQKYNIPLLLPEKPRDIIEQLQSYNAEASVLVAYGKIIPESVINIFPKGIINIHPSLLPHYRGPTPIEQAILDGAPETGVSLMQLAKGMDNGPIYAQAKITLNGDESKQALTTKLLTLGGELLIKNLPSILSGQVLPTPQDESKATYAQLFTKAQGNIDWQKPAINIEREIRAYLGWPKSHAQIFGHEVIISKAQVASSPIDGALVQLCGQNTYLEIQELIAPSGRKMDGKNFLQGYKYQNNSSK
ncbi:MAG TPA: methionyl-tRNA formyltransferase [Candidatus Acidoferrum sp.]|nr:methionyl-tRNA formyltransferase [Candidatus Acidoferrum sp.]